MSGYHTSYVSERLDVMAEWDETAIVDALRITSDDLLKVPEFRHRAERWIEENCE